MVEAEEPLTSEDFTRWCEEVRRSSAEDFSARHRCLFFLVHQPAVNQHKVEFETVDINCHASDLSAASRPGSSGFHVIPVTKSPHNPYKDRVSIGRARNCDIVIRHASISKLHAHVRADENGSYTITDLGSHNGTRVNDRVLAPQVPEPLRPSSTVTLGTVVARVLDAASLHAGLLRLHAILHRR